MDVDLKPIETTYNGYRFRSRLEARWAVFFDTVGIKWEYEKEGYDLGEAGYYLPDFWLYENKMFAEVKGQEFTQSENFKARKLSETSGNPVLKLCGVPELKIYTGYGIFKDGLREGLFQFQSCTFYHGFIPTMFYSQDVWVELCNTIWKQYVSEKQSNGLSVIEMVMFDTYQTMTKGINAAKSARFEHGEKPLIKENKIKKSEIPKNVEVPKKQIMKTEVVHPIRTHVVIDSPIKTELDAMRIVTTEGYQISPQFLTRILESEYPEKALEYLLNTIDENIFVIEPESVNLSQFGL